MPVFRRFLIAAVCVSLAAATAACIKRESVSTWYIDPNGAVTWSILERDVRSDAGTRAERLNEEDMFITAAKSRLHPAGTGLMRVGGSGVKTTVVHDKAPFVVLTEAQFPGLDQLARRFLGAFRLVGTSFVTRDGDAWVWTLTIEGESEAVEDDQAAIELEALLADKLQVALREGHFTKAEGFSIGSEGRIATLQGNVFDIDLKSSGPATLKLVWEVD